MKTLLIIMTFVILQVCTRLNIQFDPQKRDFILLWEDQADKKSNSTKEGYLYSLGYFKKFVNAEKFPIRKVNEVLFQSFKKYLLDNCKNQNTASLIFGHALTIQSVADRMKLIRNPFQVKRIASVRTLKDYLTDSEIAILVDTYCDNFDVKRAFIFSCISGLRISDLRQVRYCDLVKKKGKYFLSIIMHKTKQPIYNELHEKVKNIIFSKQNKGDKIFPGLPVNNASVNYYLQKWIKEASIEKHITMHSGRFTYGVNIMEETGSISAVQVALGHKSILTTMWAYAFIKPENLRKATRLDGVKLTFGKVKNTKKKAKKPKNKRRKKG